MDHAAIVGLSLDPLTTVTHLIERVLTKFIESGRDDLTRLLDRYLYTTVDTIHPGDRPFTSNPNLARLNGGLAIAGDVLIGGVVLFSSMRSMFEHTLRAKYSLKQTIPRVLLAVAVMHSSLLFMQMAIDLNNALGHVALQLGDGPQAAPWSSPLAPPTIAATAAAGDLFHAVFALALVVAVVILAFAYVVRAALLSILVVTAPLAALCMALPDTREYAHTWMRLFLVSLFMQALQLIVLRVATVTAFSQDAGLAATLYALATLWIMLKVPGALSTASHMESKARTVGHEAFRHALKAIHPAHHAASHRTAA